jgi:hypothetical protein
MANWTRIRDRILVDETLQAKILASAAEGERVRLLGRIIEHAQGFHLRLPGRNVELVATQYDAKGGSIDVTPEPTPKSPKGGAGARGVASANPRNSRPGLPGEAGPPGAGGKSGASIMLLCEHIVEALLVARGGAGGDGGDGGNGGRGGDGRQVREEIIDGTGGGVGGAAGRGGNGGRGGSVEVGYLLAKQPPVVDVTGGAAGEAGAPGSGGEPGRLSGEPRAARGPGSTRGRAGALGRPRSAHGDSDGYWTGVRELLDSDATAWAAHRLATGLYFYRCSQHGVAMQEFSTVLLLRPRNRDPEALRCIRQILANQNVLGLPLDLDVPPDFRNYISRYTEWGALLTDFTTNATNLLLTASSTEDGASMFEVYAKEIEQRIAVDALEVEAARRGLEASTRSAERSRERLNELSKEVEASLQKMAEEHSTIDIGTVFMVVQVAVAIIGIGAAAYTGGASLLALRPGLATLADVAEPLASKELTDVSPAEVAEVSKAYKGVGKEIGDVVGAGKKLVSLVGTIEKLTKGKTPDNSKHVELLRKLAEATLEVLIANLRLEQVSLTVAARELQHANDVGLRDTALDVLAQLQQGAEVLEEAGLESLKNTRASFQLLLRALFEAQRAAEIHTFQDLSARVHLEAGYIHPDIERDYTEGEIRKQALISAYTRSWALMLSPLELERVFLDHEKHPAFALSSGVFHREFADPDTLATLKRARRISFDVTLADLPVHNYEVRVYDVYVALVQAQAPIGVVRCRVGRGPVYIVRTRFGEAKALFLSGHVTEVQAGTVPLDAVAITALTQPSWQSRTNDLWGYAVAGTWELSVPVGENVDLAGVTRVEVLITTLMFI